MKQNCWDYKNCDQRTNCPAYTEKKLNGIHSGENGGRSCWMIAGTLCGDKVQGRFAQKIGTCQECAFYKAVKHEEGKSFKLSAELLKIIK